MRLRRVLPSPAKSGEGVRVRTCLPSILVAALMISCGDKSEDPKPPTPQPTSTVVTPDPPQPAGSPSPSATPTRSPETERTAVVDAASAALGGARYVSPLTLPACLEGNPERKPCIELRTAPEQLARGLARFTLGDPDGGASMFLMGRMLDGRWAYWRGTQQQSYLLEALPGQLLACGKDGTAEVRAEPAPSSAIIATPPNLSPLAADEVVLTVPGQYGVGGQRGQAWYRLTSPARGWIDATLATDARLADCLLHDQLEQADRG